MNLTYTGYHRFLHRTCRYWKFAGLLVRRPRYLLLCGDCLFCRGACGKDVETRSSADRKQEYSSGSGQG